MKIKLIYKNWSSFFYIIFKLVSQNSIFLFLKAFPTELLQLKNDF